MFVGDAKGAALPLVANLKVQEARNDFYCDVLTPVTVFENTLNTPPSCCFSQRVGCLKGLV